MIKCMIDEKSTEIHASGSTASIASNIVELINNIYHSMNEEDSKKAEDFKDMILESTEIMFMTPEEIHEAAKDKATEAIAELLKNAPDEVRSMLMEMLKDAEQ